MKERRGTPETHQRWSSVISRSHIAVFRPEFDRRVFISRIVKLQLVDRRKLLVSLRRKIIPDVAGLGVRAEGASCICLDQAQRITLFVRKKIVLQEVGLRYLGAKPRDRLRALRVGDAGRLFARVTAGATFREN